MLLNMVKMGPKIIGETRYTHGVHGACVEWFKPSRILRVPRRPDLEDIRNYSNLRPISEGKKLWSASGPLQRYASLSSCLLRLIIFITGDSPTALQRRLVHKGQKSDMKSIDRSANVLSIFPSFALTKELFKADRHQYCRQGTQKPPPQREPRSRTSCDLEEIIGPQGLLHSKHLPRTYSVIQSL